MRLRSLLVLFALSTCGLAAAHADGIGTPVTGGLYFNGDTGNYFNPALGYVPAGYGNVAGTTVTIGAGTEFGYFDGANFDTADFTGNTLSIGDINTYGAYPFEMTFTNPTFTGFTELTNNVGYTYTFSGHTLDIFFPEIDNPGTYSGLFSYGPPAAVTPEPSSLILLGTGALGLLGVARRRFARNS